jgi:hypothetical protein
MLTGRSLPLVVRLRCLLRSQLLVRVSFIGPGQVVEHVLACGCEATHKWHLREGTPVPRNSHVNSP